MTSLPKLLLGAGPSAIFCGMIVSSSFLSGCAPAGAPSQTDQGSQIQFDNNPRPEKACFPGTSSSPLCFAPIEVARLPEQAKLYHYQDPYSSPDFPSNFDKSLYIPPDRLLDFRTISPSTWISSHFTRNELMPSGPERGFFGVFSPLVLSHIEGMRQALGRPINITSGYRSPGHNSSIDRAANWSRHTYGDGIDFKVPGVRYADLKKLCAQFDAAYDQLYTDHIHCDWRKAPHDRAFFPDGSTTSPALKKLILQSVAQTARLKVEGSTISAEIFKEDPDSELLVEWELTHSDGRVELKTGSTIDLPLSDGPIEIKVMLGGNVELRRVFTP